MNFVKKNPKIYILSGKAGNGKSLSASIMKETFIKKSKKAISLSYASYLKEYAKNILKWDGSEEKKPRKFLQELGVDLIKNKIDNHFLIRRLIEDINIYSYFYDIIIISDARFIEEIEDIKEIYSDVTVIHIKGNDNHVLTEEESQHISEVALDEYNKYDYEIINNSRLEDLKNKLIEIIEVTYE